MWLASMLVRILNKGHNALRENCQTCIYHLEQCMPRQNASNFLKLCQDDC